MSHQHPSNLEVAHSLDTPPELLEHAPFLLADFDALGGDVAEDLQPLIDAGVPPGRAIDLGCGKGAHTVALAQRGWTVSACDLFPPFVELARDRAREAGVAERCVIECANIRDFAAQQPPHDADLVLLLAVGRPFGSLAETLDAARRLARPGGHILFDDGFLADDAPAAEEGERRAEAIAIMCRHGGEIIALIEPSLDELRAKHARELELLTTRAEALRRERPKLGAPIDAFLENQRNAYRQMEGFCRPAAALIRTPNRPGASG